MIKRIIIGLFMIATFNSPTAIGSELEDIEKYLDDMLHFQLDFKEQEVRLSNTIDIVSKNLVVNSNDPYLWYLKGRSSMSMLYVHGKIYGNENERHKEMRNQIPVELEKGFAVLVGSDKTVLIGLSGSDGRSSLALIKRNLLSISNL